MLLVSHKDDYTGCVKRGGSYPVQADYFDNLPDHLVQFVLNKLADIKALGRCGAVSKRFNTLVSQVENVVVKVDCVITGEEGGGSLNAKGKGILGQFLKCVLGGFAKPFQALQQLMGPRKSLEFTDLSHHSPGEVLKNFNQVRRLCIELPGGELGIEDGVLLKWKAEFGSTLQSCVILGASSLGKKAKESREVSTSSDEDDTGSIPESFYTNGGLKLRVVWTISSLIAASARHFLLQRIICDHPTLENLVLTDADGQGMLSMDKEHLQEFRNKPLAASASSNRTQVPALNMTLWYAPSLDLPDGSEMRGATLVTIRPSDEPVRRESDGFLAAAFEEPFKSAVAALVRRRTYFLEMNSF